MNLTANITTFDETNMTASGMQGRSYVLSARERQIVEAVFYAGLTTLVCVVGIPNNVINCLVFWRQGIQDRMNMCLFSLSLVDCVYLMNSFVMYSAGSFIILYDEIIGEEYQTKAISFLFGVSSALRSSSRFIGVIIAVERCVCVVVPLIASTIMRTSTMVIAILVSFIVFQVCYAFIPVSFQAKAVLIGENKHWIFLPTRFYGDNSQFFNTLIYTVLGAAFPVSTFLVVTVMTAVTVIRLRAAMKWRKKTSSTTSDTVSQQVALTVMLVTVSCIQIVTLAPSVVLELVTYFMMKLFSTEPFYELFKAISAIGNVFPQINSSVNFFVYYSRSSRFRATVNQIFAKKKSQFASVATKSKFEKQDRNASTS